jgi:hypothetical protein
MKGATEIVHAFEKLYLEAGHEYLRSLANQSVWVVFELVVDAHGFFGTYGSKIFYGKHIQEKQNLI